MKRCPECRRDYYDDSLFYCLDDGNALLEGPASGRSDPAVERTALEQDEPVTAIFQSASPSQGSFTASPHNLHEDLSPLIGRKKEIDEIESILGRRQCRLLTLTGIGGTGKTRLAQAAAWRMLLNFPDGVYFVNLAPITDHKLVIPAIAQTLNIKESGIESILDALQEYLIGKKMLLVVDNFEQVSQAAADIEKLMIAVPDVTFLITSREVLRLRAEYEIAVPPLALPLADGRSSVSQLSNYESIRFFVERARAVKRDFELTAANAADVVGICRHLDGIPFAIELAAARIKLFEPKAILSRLTDSLRFLTGGARSLPERQQTMRGAIAWSYDLLDRDEKQLFTILSVFAGGFTLDLAEAIGADSGIEILDTVSSLLDKNLIERMKRQKDESRFRMLVVVCDFASEQLEKIGAGDEIRERHAALFAEMAERAAPELVGSKGAEWLERLEDEHENLRAALKWTVEFKPEMALAIVASLQKFWWRRGHLTEGVEWTERILDANGGTADPELLASAYRGISSLLWSRGEFDRAVTYAEMGLKIARQTGNKRLVINALHSVGTAKHNQGDFTGAQEFSEKALKMAREEGETFEAAELANALGELARHRDDYAAAQSLYEEALENARRSGFQQLNMLAAINLAAVACQMKDYPASHAYTIESLRISEKMGNSVSVGYALERFAALAVIGNEMERAALLSGAMETIYEAAGYKIEEVDRLFLDQYLDKARSAMGYERFEKAQQIGKAMSVKDAIALAREDESEWRPTQAMRIAASDLSTDSPPSATLDQIHTTDRTIALSGDVSPNSTTRWSDRRLPLVTLVLIVVSIGGYAGYRYFGGTVAAQIESIAVMPFVNESGNPDVEYLSDGMTETLIKSLSNLPNMDVKPRSAVFRYKGREMDISTIGKDLNVQAILSGRVVQRGELLTLSLELVDVKKNSVIWTEQYNRKQSDIVSLQSEIAKDVSAKLTTKLSGAVATNVAKTETTDSEAYQAYLKGRYLWNRRTAENIRLAIEQFKTATDRDPDYAQAYVGLADCYTVLGEYAGLPALATLPPAKAYAERAIELDGDLAEPHATLGLIHKLEWDWSESEAEFKRAIELNPKYATSYHWYSILLRSLGRFEETASAVKQAEKLDPLSSIIAVNVSDAYQMLGDHNSSVDTMLKVIDLDPTFSAAYENLGASYLKLGRNAEGIASLEKAVELSKRSAVRLRGLGYGYAVTGRRSEALAIAKELEEKYAKRESNGQYVAAVYAGLGDKDKAFEWLEKDFQNHHGSLPDIVWRIHFESLRDDPRYKDLLRRMNLPE
ncbi:MAG: tetratricopeptide repeat protein [Acidobacteria bacterium]|nr:tetratricopeptide repeat protein [Acidobacteriota bacterium]